MTLLRDERWPVARLIPITSSTGVEAKERNAASALLAVLSHVDEFAFESRAGARLSNHATAIRTQLQPLVAPQLMHL
jgi:hypothetical protein